VQRGNDRIAVFRDVTDYQRYLDILFQSSRDLPVSVHAYVLMTNHVHLLLTPHTAESPARLIQRIGRGYVRYFNTKYGRTGTLWEARYRSSVVDTERYLLACTRYIERNPVRAGMVASATEYRWSSFHHTAFGVPDRILTVHPVLESLGSTPTSRRAAYRALFAEELEPGVVEGIRRSTQRGDATGSAAFISHLESSLGRTVVRHPHGGRFAPPGAPKRLHRRTQTARTESGALLGSESSNQFLDDSDPERAPPSPPHEVRFA